MEKQRGSTLEHRELYSVACDKSEWIGIHKKKNAYICITESLCYIAVVNTML